MKRFFATLFRGCSFSFIATMSIWGGVGCGVGVIPVITPSYASFMSAVIAFVCLLGFYLDKPPALAEEKPKIPDDQRAFSRRMLKQVQEGILSFERQMRATVLGGKICFGIAGILVGSQLAKSPIPTPFLLALASPFVGVAIGHVFLLPKLSRKGEQFYSQVKCKINEASSRAKIVAGFLKTRPSNANWSEYNPTADQPNR